MSVSLCNTSTPHEEGQSCWSIFVIFFSSSHYFFLLSACLAYFFFFTSFFPASLLFCFSSFFFSSIFSPILWVKLCLSKNIYIKNPNLQYHRIGPYLETRSLSMYLIKVRSYWSREGLKSNMAGIFIRKGKGEDAAGRWSYED